nr:hypothetical protein [Tanacetum cinerariifolium]
TTSKNNKINQKVNTVRAKHVNTARPKVNTARPKAILNDVQGNQGNLQLELHEKGVSDSRCSRHMTGNMFYLSEYEEIDGGYVAFGGDTKGGKITSKGKISTDTKCVVLSSDFKLLDESQVFLRVLRKNNMYSVDLKNVAPSGGKFDGKADEGLFVGYSVNRKAFRVSTSRTRIVEETLHITFLQNKPNVVGSGPTWLFDIDALTKSMNYKPVVAGNQSNGSAVSRILLVMDSNHQGRRKKDAEDLRNEDNEVLSTEEPRVNQEKDANVNSTNNINTIKEIVYSDDDKDVGAEANMFNLDTNLPVSPILTTRIYKDHPVEQIIIDIHSVPQTRRMTKSVVKHGLQVTPKDDGIFISQDNYVDEILKKSGFLTVKTASTPMETSKPLMKDENVKDVDVHLYRSMISSLMYLISLRPGLWYPKDSPFNLEAYTDSDYAGVRLDRKSTTEGVMDPKSNAGLWIQFHEYQDFIDNESTICIVKNLVFHSKTKHIEIRHHFIRDSYEKRLIQMIKIHIDHNVTAAKDRIEVNIGNLSVNASGHYLMLLGIT